MNDIQLEQLRDIAIEYLPDAQKERDNFKQWERVKHLTQRDYATRLASLTTPLRHKSSLLAVERAAANLLYAVTMWQSYEPNDPELADIDHAEYREDSMRKITGAAEELQTITGRDIIHLMPADTHAAKVATLPETNLSNEEIPGKMPKTSIGMLAIKAAWQIECKTKKRATAKQVIEKLQAWTETEPELTEAIPHGVKWTTTKGKEKPFDIEACAKALETWQASRA